MDNGERIRIFLETHCSYCGRDLPGDEGIEYLNFRYCSEDCKDQYFIYSGYENSALAKYQQSLSGPSWLKDVKALDNFKGGKNAAI